ncbi:polysaccharide pyruvyl transferase family protein [Peribacillus simplex]|uniref:polysaccharide pyruvyl transferase family protein n=1 Tax=Peribacillus simplex TaxID=1478 RepID=UPI003D2E5C36
MSKALVISFFKSNNLGDLALSEAMENLISSKGLEIIKYDFGTVSRVTDNINVLSFDKKVDSIYSRNSVGQSIISLIKKTLIFLVGTVNFGLLRFYIKKPLSYNKWATLNNDIKESDILVIGGGNMLMDINPSWPDLFEDYLSLAKKHKKDIYILYIGAGPIRNKRSEKIYKNALNSAKKVTVRDPLSKEVCNNIINEKFIVESVDPVFSLPINLFDYRINRINKLQKETKINIGISVLGDMCFDSKNSHEKYLECLAGLIKSLNLRLKNQVEFILFSTEIADYNAVHKLNDLLNSCDIKSIVYLRKVDEVTNLFKKLDFLIGGRMHGLIFSQKCLLPFIGVFWQEKIKGFSNVTKSKNKIYEVSYIMKNQDVIIDRVISDVTNIDRVKQMNETNKTLYDKVLNGNIE